MNLVLSPWYLVLGPLGLRALRAVFRPPLLAALDAPGAERSANHVISDTRQVLHTAAADEHQRVLLQVVADAGDIGGDFDAVGQADAGHLAEGRVRLLRRLREHADTHTALL